MRSKGVSNLVSALLLTIITLAAGALLVATYVIRASLAEQSVERYVISEEAGLARALIYMGGFINGSELRMYLATGSTVIRVLGIYINDTLATSRCSLVYGGSSWVLDPRSIAVVKCFLPYSSRMVVVKIVYEGGEIEFLVYSING